MSDRRQVTHFVEIKMIPVLDLTQKRSDTLRNKALEWAEIEQALPLVKEWVEEHEARKMEKYRPETREAMASGAMAPKRALFAHDRKSIVGLYLQFLIDCEDDFVLSHELFFSEERVKGYFRWMDSTSYKPATKLNHAKYLSILLRYLGADRSLEYLGAEEKRAQRRLIDLMKGYRLSKGRLTMFQDTQITRVKNGKSLTKEDTAELWAYTARVIKKQELASTKEKLKKLESAVMVQLLLGLMGQRREVLSIITTKNLQVDDVGMYIINLEGEKTLPARGAQLPIPLECTRAVDTWLAARKHLLQDEAIISFFLNANGGPISDNDITSYIKSFMGEFREGCTMTPLDFRRLVPTLLGEEDQEPANLHPENVAFSMNTSVDMLNKHYNRATTTKRVAKTQQSFGETFLWGKAKSVMKQLSEDVAELDPPSSDSEPGESSSEAEESSSEVEYEVESILDHTFNEDGEREFLVAWLGYDEPTWEPESNVKHLDKYEEYFKKLNQSKKRKAATTLHGPLKKKK